MCAPAGRGGKARRGRTRAAPASHSTERASREQACRIGRGKEPVDLQMGGSRGCLTGRSGGGIMQTSGWVDAARCDANASGAAL